MGRGGGQRESERYMGTSTLLACGHATHHDVLLPINSSSSPYSIACHQPYLNYNLYPVLFARSLLCKSGIIHSLKL